MGRSLLPEVAARRPNPDGGSGLPGRVGSERALVVKLSTSGDAVPTCREALSARLDVGSVLDCFSQPAAVVGRDRRIRAANAAYLRTFSPHEPVCGRFCHEVSHRSPLPCVERGEACPVDACLEQGRAQRVVHVHHTPKGPNHIEIQAFPIRGESGEIEFFLVRGRPLDDPSAEDGNATLVGASPAFNRVLELIERVAGKETAVLLEGESGTGKELVAAYVHRRSARSKGPFVPVDCSGIAESLFESEMFGHERGSFTGAIHRKQGMVELAHGGTLFLDEIGEVPLAMQVKLLRLLESGLFRRVGSTEYRHADFRLISATNRDLRELVARGEFRTDLFYRINTFPVVLPPLRDRIVDLELLLDALRRRLGCRPTCRLAPEVVDRLRAYAFPGNIRELRNILERACLLADDGLIEVRHLPEEIAALGLAAEDDLEATLDLGEIPPLESVERRYLEFAMSRFDGSRQELARRLGLSERSLYRRLAARRQSDD